MQPNEPGRGDAGRRRGPIGRGLAAGLGLGVLGLLAGCGLTSGVWFPEEEKNLLTTNTRWEAEFLPRAQMVKEDAMPKWGGGRHAFTPGADRLLVLTRITTFVRKGLGPAKESGQPGPLETANRIERVWITIPYGTPLGKVLRLEELDLQHLAGYDRTDVDPGFYCMPFSIKGKVALLEERPDTAVVRLDMELVPQSSLRWNLAETTEAPVTTTGIHATPANTGEVMFHDRLYKTQREAWKTKPPAADDNSDTLASATQPATQPGAVATATQPAATQPGALAAATTRPAATQPATQPATLNLAGTKWHSTYPPDWEVRWQFDSDGNFTIASTHGNEPMVHCGIWKVENGYVLIRLDKYYQLKRTGYQLDHLPGLRSKVAVVKLVPRGSGLVANGELEPVLTQGRPELLIPVYFPDMNKVPPPAGQWPPP